MLTSENMETVLRKYENGSRIALGNQPAITLPGVILVLEYLINQPDVQMVAAIGNTEQGFKWKLQLAKINQLLIT